MCASTTRAVFVCTGCFYWSGKGPTLKLKTRFSPSSHPNSTCAIVFLFPNALNDLHPKDFGCPIFKTCHLIFAEQQLGNGLHVTAGHTEKNVLCPQLYKHGPAIHQVLS